MKLTLEETAQLRGELYALNPDGSAQDRQKYEKLRGFYIGQAEGTVLHTYRDVLGLVTVGIGFNMERKEARDEWNYAFGSTSIDFDDVYQGLRPLTNEEATQLFQSGLELRERNLRETYADIWGRMRPNERLATESAFYNGACLVRGPERDTQNRVARVNGVPQGATRYYTHMETYILQKDLEGLLKAVEELRDHSNRRGIPGLATRRASEAELLSSFKVDGFLIAA